MILDEKYGIINSPINKNLINTRGRKMEEIELQKVDKGTPLAENLLNFVKNFSWLDVKEHTVRVLENWEFEEWETP
ncbi:MAG: hypothetical protein E7678_01950, partial [Ruminococcaceae bacterium]|nr:hypothetical protein [Oscillospiraceae bacterium]